MMALAILASVGSTSAFVPNSLKNAAVYDETSLNAMPPMIIGPMIRKMREEKEKKKMPMATGDETKGQAPGLRVGGQAWKWPPVWPYESDFFLPPEDIPKPPAENQLSGMAGMLSGMPSIPTTDEIEAQAVDTLDAVKYWAEEKAEVKTEMDEDSIEKLKR
jgi:hypothetical protein